MFPCPLALNARVQRGQGNPVYTWSVENVSGRTLWLPRPFSCGGAQMIAYRFWGTLNLPLPDPALFEVEWVELLPWETVPLWQNTYSIEGEPDEMTVQVHLRDDIQEEIVSLLWESGHKMRQTKVI